MVLDHSKMMEARQTTSIPLPLPPEPTRIKPPLPTTYLPTAEQKELMLAKLSAEMAAKRQFIRDHAAEIHASLERAFPLGQLLKKLENSSLSP